MKFEEFEKKKISTICNGYLSQLCTNSIFNQYFYLVCIYQLFLILNHTKSFVEKTL